MDKVIDNLWVGTLAAALEVDTLRKNGIKSILSVMRGRLPIDKSFARYQVLLDDHSDADALVHFPACVEWIDSQINKGRGVLVHCHAGMSRSATIAAAYLMHAKNLNVQASLDLISKARPMTQPNDGFLAQLAIFYSANYKRTRRNKETRAFYVDRAVKEVMNGDGSGLEMDMFAKYPHSPGDSMPATPFQPHRRRLRCKMCRQELATREHLIDHGQVGPATPAAGNALSPASSRRPSSGETILVSRKSSNATEQVSITITQNSNAPEPGEQIRRPSFGSAMAKMTVIHASPTGKISSATPSSEHDLIFPRPEAVPLRRKSSVTKTIAGLSMSPIVSPTIGVESEPGLEGDIHKSIPRRRRSLLGLKDYDSNQQTNAVDGFSISAVESDEEDVQGVQSQASDAGIPSAPLSSPQELAAQIHPTLAALRSSPLISALRSNGPLGMTPLKNENGTAGATPNSRSPGWNGAIPPLLMPDSKCSGYFVEPMKWMQAFLEEGQMAGKIVCPNKKCGAKLGNYDWAGVGCSCKEWVVPGFCIHKSKVDEVVV